MSMVSKILKLYWILARKLDNLIRFLSMFALALLFGEWEIWPISVTVGMGQASGFVPSAAQLLKFYEVYDRVIASAKLIPSTIVNSTGRYSYSVSVESFNPHMSSNQLDAEFYWG